MGFSGRLPSLVLAFHVASEANFLEDFAAGVHISSQSCDLELVLCLHHKFPSVKLLYNIHIKITPSLERDYFTKHFSYSQEFARCVVVLFDTSYVKI